jgi:hypothetical protein
LLTKIAQLKIEIRDKGINTTSIFKNSTINNTRSINLPEINTTRYKGTGNHNTYGRDDLPYDDYLDKMSRNRIALSYNPDTSNGHAPFPDQRLSSLTPPEHIPSHTETPSSSESASASFELNPPSSMGNKFEEASWNASSSESLEQDSRGGMEKEGEEGDDPGPGVAGLKMGFEETHSKSKIWDSLESPLNPGNHLLNNPNPLT